jgi:hypothetical protein
VIGGDVLPGPMAHETLRCLLDLDIPVQFIYGNSEVAVLQQMAGTTPARVPEQYRPAIRWTADEVQDYRDVVAAWPMTLRVDVRGLGNVLFCHATPRNEDECFTRLTPEDRLLPVYDDSDGDCSWRDRRIDQRRGRAVSSTRCGARYG